jgi:hypothetical protein
MEVLKVFGGNKINFISSVFKFPNYNNGKSFSIFGESP